MVANSNCSLCLMLFSFVYARCIVIFREIDSRNGSKDNIIGQPRGACVNSLPMVPVSTIRTVSLSKSSHQMVSGKFSLL